MFRSLAAFVALSDEKKGEKVILLIQGYEKVSELKKALVDSGMNALTIPSDIFDVETVPKLGSGKSDFAGAKKLAMELTGVK